MIPCVVEMATYRTFGGRHKHNSFTGPLWHRTQQCCPCRW